MSEGDVTFVLTDANDAVLIHSDHLKDSPKNLNPRIMALTKSLEVSGRWWEKLFAA